MIALELFQLLAQMTQSDNRLRIVHVTNYQVPGFGYDEIQLSREQVRMGHDVTIITSNYLHPQGLYSVLRRRFPSRRVEPREEFVDGVRVKRLRSHEFARRVWIRGLAKSVVELNPDVIHCHNLLQFHPARLVALRAQGRYRGAIVVDDHMHHGFVRRTPLGRLFYKAYRMLGQPILARHVDRFCAIADDTRDYLRTDCGVKTDISVVPLGVAAGAFVSDPDRRQRTRQRLGVGSSDLVLIYTGKVIPEKGVHILVEAAGQLRAEGLRVSVVVVGDADQAYEQRLVSLASAGTRRLDLHLVPSVDNDSLPEWYGAADVGVWPRQESMGVFEAMAAGIPVVVSSTSGLAHLVAPDRGLTYEPDKPEALADCLRGLTWQDRMRLGQAAREFAATELTWRLSAERYIAIYREAIAARGHHECDGPG
jgi:glycosyltransferase involved in cell wall biosynthesis